MSHCAIRICSSSCHAVCGTPSGRVLISSSGKSLSAASGEICADSPWRTSSKCSLSHASLPFSISKEYQMKRLGFDEFTRELGSRDLLCPERFDMRSHDLRIEPSGVAGTKVIDQKQKR